MTTKGGVPDAWDDDWVSKADVHYLRSLCPETGADILQKSPTASAPVPVKPAKLTKAEKRAQQAEFNRQLWEEAYVL